MDFFYLWGYSCFFNASLSTQNEGSGEIKNIMINGHTEVLTEVHENVQVIYKAFSFLPN